MCAERILVTPEGYDNVHQVLVRLGGQNARARQLVEREMTQLRSQSFLSGTELLFLNCSNDIRDRAGDKAFCQAIRDFVLSGGTLYASDWADGVVAAAFGDQVGFDGGGGGKAGTVSAKVSDPYLSLRLSHSIQLTFDMDEWVRMTRFPNDADFYITDAANNPLAIGFTAGRGRVVYTSFHHHAQQAADEAKILDWLVRLPGQHQLLLVTNQVQNRHGTVNRSQVTSTVANSSKIVPVRTGQGSGLGVFSLTWKQDDRVELGMQYLRGREIPTGEALRSGTPPLVLTVRDPSSRDGIEISKHAIAGDEAVLSEPEPFVFAAGLRPDLLGDPDWLAAAVLRHLTGLFGADMNPATAREVPSPGQVLQIVGVVLAGLGYRIRQAQDREPEMLAWPLNREEGPPALRAGVIVADRTDLRPDARPLVYPAPVEPDPATEHLLAAITLEAGRTDFDWADEEDVRWRRPPAVRSSSEVTEWTPVASASGALGPGHEVISVADYRLNYHVGVAIYRAEPSGTAPKDGSGWTSRLL
jgi:hypothetical protein